MIGRCCLIIGLAVLWYFNYNLIFCCLFNPHFFFSLAMLILYAKNRAHKTAQHPTMSTATTDDDNDNDKERKGLLRDWHYARIVSKSQTSFLFTIKIKHIFSFGSGKKVPLL
jgi:hypothetical protein